MPKDTTKFDAHYAMLAARAAAEEAGENWLTLGVASQDKYLAEQMKERGYVSGTQGRGWVKT